MTDDETTNPTLPPLLHLLRRPVAVKPEGDQLAGAARHHAPAGNAYPVIGRGVGRCARIIESLGVKRVWIGHSFGGLVAQRLLADDVAAAAVAIDPAPIKGVIFLPPSALRVASIALRNPANRTRAVSLTE